MAGGALEPWPADWRGTAWVNALALCGALVSVGITGYVFGYSNNIFHLPIVAALYGEPQFAHDPFIQSLRYFASGLWLVLEGSASVVDPYWLFLVLHVLSRFLSFAGFLSCAALLGIVTTKQQIILIILLCCTTLLRNHSFAGNGGLFINQFSHSELTNGLTLLMLACSVRAQVGRAIALNGLVFFTNAFVAVWNAVPLLLLLGWLYRDRRAGGRSLVLQILAGGGVALALALPVLVNVLSNPDLAKPLGVPFAEFVRQYYAAHFLFGTIDPVSKLFLGLVTVLAFVSFVVLGMYGKPFTIAVAGYVIVYAIGSVVPYATDSHFVLNLELLRSGSMLHLLAALGCASVATRWMTEGNDAEAFVLGPLLAVSVCAGYLTLLAAPFLLLLGLYAAASHSASTPVLYRRLAPAVTVLGCVALLWPAFRVNLAENRADQAWINQWSQLGRWAFGATPKDATFLVPPGDLDLDSSTFTYFAHRKVWVEMKSGAAAMWSPPYYRTWWPRLQAVRSLASLDQRIAYARANGLAYVIDPCLDGAAEKALFRSGRLCVYPVETTQGGK